MTLSVSTFLMFQGAAQQALDLYTAVFQDAVVEHVEHYGPGEQAPEGQVKAASFTLAGQRFRVFDSPPVHEFTFTPAVSIFVDFDDAEEHAAAYEALSEGGAALMPFGEYGFSRKFGWVSDRFGVSWQLNLV